MNDVLLEIGKNPRARKLVRALGLPLPLPENLRREKGPFSDAPLEGRTVLVHGTSELAASVGRTIEGARGTVVREAPKEGTVDGIVLDASGLGDVAGLRALYDVLHPIVGRLARSGRVVVLARVKGAGEAAAAAQSGVEGFVRSVAKEIGKLGATANLVRVGAGAEDRALPVVLFLLSPRSAFVTAQPVVVDARAKSRKNGSLGVRPLRGKTALVTGAARGIGEATARQLADEGAHVLCVDRPEDGDALLTLAHAIGGTAVPADLTAPGAIDTIVAAVKEKGGVDVVVQNAGITRDKTLARMDASQWDAVLGVNLEAVVRLGAALEPHVRDGGRIVCLSSIAGLAGNVGQTAYATSKAAMVGYVAALAERLASRGITVNAIAPGFIETRLTKAIPVAVREVARRLSALGQGGQPEDVANAITFLARPDADGISGRTLRVCGGAFVGA